MFYTRIEKQKKIGDNAIHITILNPLATFHGTKYWTKTFPLELWDSMFTGNTQAMYHGVKIRQTTVKFKIFLITTSFFEKRPSSSCLINVMHLNV